MPTFTSIVSPTGAKATGRRTLLEIIDELARPVNAADETVRALAADSFRAAVRTINRKGFWPWEIQEEDVSITANTPLSTVTSAIKKPLAMHFLDEAAGTEDQPISYMPYDKFLESYSLDITSEPYIYTIPNLYETGQIQWFPTPGSDDNARFAFYRVTPIPRNETEAVEIPDYATEMYMAEAWVEFVKRCPAARSALDPGISVGKAHMAFREMSAHVNSPGDRSR
jgi:hypothetical protein